MKHYCLAAQSTVWSSCDCINLSDLISCSHEWEKMREREREGRKFGVPEISKECNKVSGEENNSDVCFVTPLKPSSLSFCLQFVFRRRTETLDIQTCGFGTELSSQSNWSRDRCAEPPVASKAAQRPRRIHWHDVLIQTVTTKKSLLFP